MLAVLLEPLHDQVEGVRVFESKESLDDKGRGAQEEDLALRLQPVEAARALVDDLHREHVLRLPLAREPHGGVRAALDLAHHLEVGEARRLALRERVGRRHVHDGLLKLSCPRASVLQRRDLALAGSADVGPDGGGRRLHDGRNEPIELDGQRVEDGQRGGRCGDGQQHGGVVAQQVNDEGGGGRGRAEDGGGVGGGVELDKLPRESGVRARGDRLALRDDLAVPAGAKG